MRIPTKESRIREITSAMEGEVVDDPLRAQRLALAHKRAARADRREEAAMRRPEEEFTNDS